MKKSKSPEKKHNKRRSTLVKSLNLFQNNGNPGEVVYGRYVQDLPSKKIAEVENNAQSAYCLPAGCLLDVHKLMKKKDEDDDSQETIIKNVSNWKDAKDYADGIVTTLYEIKSSNREIIKFVGDPIADSLAVVTRHNSAILALADGVSWGHKSRLASICSIYGSVKYLDEHLSSCKNTREVFKQILKAFEQAQQCIVDQHGTMTTLCVGVVVPLQEKKRYGLCVVNVGDSYAYVFNKHYGVKEVTEGSHPVDELRDMRHSGGALGPVDGYNPDLSNLTCSFVILEEGDLVFLCSDGISDNFDPVVSKILPYNLPPSNESIEKIDGHKDRKLQQQSLFAGASRSSNFKEYLPISHEDHTPPTSSLDRRACTDQQDKDIGQKENNYQTSERNLLSSASMDKIYNECIKAEVSEGEYSVRCSSFTEEKESHSIAAAFEKSEDIETNQSSLDKSGRLVKQLTPKERRDAALQQMTDIISTKLNMDKNLMDKKVNVGEICAQFVNFVISNTNQKRTILEKVPQSELNKMTSRERRLHNEKVKKELEDVPGKLDHASIVCYEVGCHGDKHLQTEEQFFDICGMEGTNTEEKKKEVKRSQMADSLAEILSEIRDLKDESKKQVTRLKNEMTSTQSQISELRQLLDEDELQTSNIGTSRMGFD